MSNPKVEVYSVWIVYLSTCRFIYLLGSRLSAQYAPNVRFALISIIYNELPELNAIVYCVRYARLVPLYRCDLNHTRHADSRFDLGVGVGYSCSYKSIEN